MVFKMGFRWRPVDFAVESTPLDTPPPCHFNPFRVKPMFDPSPALNVIPTLLDRLPTPDASATPLPWGTAPVPPLQPLPPRPIYSKKSTSRESVGGGSSTRTRSKTRTTAVAVPTQPGPSTVAVPPVRPVGPSKQTPKPDANRVHVVLRPQPIPLGSVTLQGVPGSSHRGVDLVSMNSLINAVISFYVLDYGFKT